MLTSPVTGVDHRKPGPIEPPAPARLASCGGPRAHRFPWRQGEHRVLQRLSFLIEDVSGVKVMTLAPTRVAAFSNESRVRVEGSKKTVVTVSPSSSVPEVPPLELLCRSVSALIEEVLEATEANARSVEQPAHATATRSIHTP